MKRLSVFSLSAWLWALCAHAAFGQVWTTSNVPNNLWFSIASSADGAKLLAADGTLWVSTNSGLTWSDANSPTSYQQWRSVACSADGTKFVAINVASDMWISDDSGTTWVGGGPYYPSGAAIYWTSVASSADGTKLIAAENHGNVGFLWLSTDSGTTWTPAAFSNYWNVVTSSADGNKLAAMGYGGPIYISTNAGATWSPGISNNSWSSLASSADGNKLVAIDTAVDIFTTANAGSSWVQQTNIALSAGAYGFSVASSADGTSLAISSRNGGSSLFYTNVFFYSTNSGNTWIQDTTAPGNHFMQMSSIAFSADGSRLVAGCVYVNGGYSPGPIYIRQTPPAPVLNIAMTNNNTLLSWILPTANFVAQEKPTLLAPNWVTLTNLPVLNLNNLCNEVLLSPASPSGFYRLITSGH